MLYEIKIVAEGVVHDADGNLLNQTPAETTVVVDEATALRLLQEANPPEVQP